MGSSVQESYLMTYLWLDKVRYFCHDVMLCCSFSFRKFLTYRMSSNFILLSSAITYSAQPPALSRWDMHSIPKELYLGVDFINIRVSSYSNLVKLFYNKGEIYILYGYLHVCLLFVLVFITSSRTSMLFSFQLNLNKKQTNITWKNKVFDEYNN